MPGFVHAVWIHTYTCMDLFLKDQILSLIEFVSCFKYRIEYLSRFERENFGGSSLCDVHVTLLHEVKIGISVVCMG